MQAVVEIGKYTLESLTTGMYASPKDLYREYIQNSVDSIDIALNKRILTRKNARINILMDRNQKKIVIEDNGAGLESEAAIRQLLDIGNSQKTYSSNRGFRGIGRLAGLSYCEKLSFVTSAHGENKRVELVFDASKLREMLIPGAFNDYNLQKVLSEVTDYKISPEHDRKHYFKVIMEGVTNIDGILNIDEIRDYLSQVAPVPYNPNTFTWSKEIHAKIRLSGYVADEYNIFIHDGLNEEQLFKVYSDEFLCDKIRKIYDQIQKICVKEIRNSSDVLQAIVWYSESNFYGTILDESKKGIRLRKGNIMVGEKSTLNHIFKEDRFNGWFQGEVYVVDPDIIPNARRDNFEKNAAYISLLKNLIGIGDELSKKIRTASSTRNYKENKALNDAEKLISKADKHLLHGFASSKEKEVVSREINSTLEAIDSIDATNELSLTRKLDLLKKLNTLTSAVKGATSYKILNLSTNLTIEQKKTLAKVFEALLEECDKELADELIVSIMKKF